MQSKPDSWWTYLTSMFDIATGYIFYVRRERTGCIVPDFPIQAPLLVHQDGRHVQKYRGVMQTYIIFNHVMKTLLVWGVVKIQSKSQTTVQILRISGKVSNVLYYIIVGIIVTCWANPTFRKNRVKTRNHNSYFWPCCTANFKVIGRPVAEIQLKMQFLTLLRSSVYYPCYSAPSKEYISEILISAVKSTFSPSDQHKNIKELLWRSFLKFYFSHNNYMPIENP